MKKSTEIRLAAVDMGTNSFHARFVLVPDKGEPVLLDRTKVMVDLAPKGVGKKLSKAARKRGLHALQTIKDEADLLEMDHVMAYATSAIREAPNGETYLKELEKETGIRGQVISGTREGELIAKGMRACLDLDDEIVLGIDIGGGSVEFIFMNADQTFSIHSKKLGVARLIKQFLENDPPTPEELKKMDRHIRDEIKEVEEDMELYKVSKVYGSSGTLRTIFNAVLYYNQKTWSDFYDIDDFNLFYAAFSRLSLSERMTFKGVDSARVELILPGLQLIHILLNRTIIDRVYYSSGALREGMIEDMLESLRSVRL